MLGCWWLDTEVGDGGRRKEEKQFLEGLEGVSLADAKIYLAAFA